MNDLTKDELLRVWACINYKKMMAQGQTRSDTVMINKLLRRVGSLIDG